MDLLEVIKHAIQWVIAPLIAWVWVLHEKVTKLQTQVAVQGEELRGQKALNEQTYTELRNSFNIIVTKLDNIEQFLRK